MGVWVNMSGGAWAIGSELEMGGGAGDGRWATGRKKASVAIFG